MKHLFFLFACLSINAFSQKMVTKEVGDFNEVKVFDLIEVNLIPSNDQKVVINGEHSEDVKIINDNGVLKLRMNTDTRFRGEDTHIEIFFRKVAVIDANEGARIVVNTVIEQENIELRSQEGGKIIAPLQVENAKVKAVSGGIVEVSGLAQSQEISLNSGGIFEGKDLKTVSTKIGILAAGEAEVNASQQVDVKITAGGDVYIYGDPETVNEKRFAGGRITRMY